jgi:ribosomal protein S18 acetylase RimI-like enzyme
VNELKYYILQRQDLFQENFEGIRRLLKEDLALVERFYSKNYDGTIFSPWILELPFFGKFRDGQLIAAGGSIVIDELGNAANIGNFLTAPDFRRQGIGKLLTKRLINELINLGITTFTLGTTEENIFAWKAYESVGFSLLERRKEIEFAAL